MLQKLPPGAPLAPPPISVVYDWSPLSVSVATFYSKWVTSVVSAQ